MGEPWERKYKSVRAVRLISQLAFLYILNAGLGPYPYPLPILGGSAPWLTFPPSFDLLQVFIASALPPLLPLASIILGNIFMGRVFCGWLCPFGLAQEVAAILGRAKRRIDPNIHSLLLKIKWFVLAASIMAPLVIGYLRLEGVASRIEPYLPRGLMVSPYSLVSPDSTLFAYMPVSIIMGLIPTSMSEFMAAVFNPIIVARYVLLVVVLVLAVRIERFWCRYLCPLGLMNSIVSKFSVLGFYKVASRCDNCGACNRVCPMQIDIARAGSGRIDMFECIGCFQCYFSCDKKAIVLTYKL